MNLDFKRMTKSKSGFTLVEALIFSLIVVIVVMTFYRTFASGAKVLRDARARISASQVANEKFEVLRNVAYENLTTDENVDPHIDRDSDVERSGISFKVHTEISYVNDEFDNPGGVKEDDTRPNDYKQIEVIVSWMSAGETKKVTMYSYIAPPGTEELYNGGILSIEIRQTNGTPVGGAMVEVRNAATNALLYGPTATLADGKVYLIGYAPGDKAYKVIVRKNGYYPVDTMPPLGQSSYDPVDEHGSVVLAAIQPMTIIFDPVSSIQLKTQDPLGNSIGNIDFFLEGGRKLGDTVPGALPVYSYVKDDHQTDASGMFTLTNESSGKYIFEYPNPATINNQEYDFWKVVPFFATSRTDFFATAASATNIDVILLPKNMPSLFLKVADEVDGTPISEATVTVKNESLSYEQTMETDQFGQVYFPKKDAVVVPLQNGEEYVISVQADGYDDQEINKTVSNLTKPGDILMHPAT